MNYFGPENFGQPHGLKIGLDFIYVLETEFAQVRFRQLDQNESNWIKLENFGLTI